MNEQSPREQKMKKQIRHFRLSILLILVLIAGWQLVPAIFPQFSFHLSETESLHRLVHTVSVILLVVLMSSFAPDDND